MGGIYQSATLFRKAELRFWWDVGVHSHLNYELKSCAIYSTIDKRKEEKENYHHIQNALTRE